MRSWHMAGLGTLQQLINPQHLPPQVTHTNPGMEDTAGRDTGPRPPTWSLPPALALWGRRPMDWSSRNPVPVPWSEKAPVKGGQHDKHQFLPPLTGV